MRFAYTLVVFSDPIVLHTLSCQSRMSEPFGKLPKHILTESFEAQPVPIRTCSSALRAALYVLILLCSQATQLSATAPAAALVESQIAEHGLRPTHLPVPLELEHSACWAGSSHARYDQREEAQ